MMRKINESDMNKNSEILQQIRKIMGNLELSDGEEDKGNIFSFLSIILEKELHLIELFS